MALTVKQGDQYSVPLTILFTDAAIGAPAPIDIDDVDMVEIMFGEFRKTYPGDVTYDSTTTQFMIPITQEESFTFPENGSIILDVRVKFTNGDVMGIKRQIPVETLDAVSKEIL